MKERDAALALLLVPGVGSRRFFKLKEAFGSAANVWEHASRDRLVQIVPGGVARAIVKGPDENLLEEIKAKIRKAGFWLLFYQDPDYPQSLKHIDDPPALLFGLGRKEALQGPCVAIVGSRKASTYGQKVCAMLSKGLALHGVTIVSGLAHGIDTWAHRACVETGGVTVAVKGCGLDVGYPARNVSLVKKIRESGAVITEFFPGVKAEPGNFPMRNRIISGLSLGVIVVEAGLRSGSLITAYLALEQGREVMAVPGNIFSYGSRGCHRLIKEGAHLIEACDEVMDILGLHFLTPQKEAAREAPAFCANKIMTDQMSIVVDKLRTGPQHIDEISASCSLPVSKVASMLTELEVSDMVVALGSGIYCLRKEDE